MSGLTLTTQIATSDMDFTASELCRKFYELSVEHCKGKSKSVIKQCQLNECPIVFLNQLREYQMEQLLANRIIRSIGCCH